jgi:hypothetical protein
MGLCEIWEASSKHNWRGIQGDDYENIREATWEKGWGRGATAYWGKPKDEGPIDMINIIK